MATFGEVAIFAVVRISYVLQREGSRVLMCMGPRHGTGFVVGAGSFFRVACTGVLRRMRAIQARRR